MAESLQDLQQMLESQVDSSVSNGLWMNLDKTKVMFNEHITPEPIVVNDSTLEVIREYVYLGQTLQLGKRLTEEFSWAGRRLVNCVESSRHLFHKAKGQRSTFRVTFVF